MNRQRVFKPTKLRLSEVEDKDLRNTIEMEFTNYRVQRQLSVEAQRKATVAALESKIREAESQSSLMKLLTKAGEAFEAIQTEAIWFAYEDAGDIVFENPFNERDMRNAVRVQRASMEQAASNLNEDDGNDLYESGEGNE